MSTEYNYPAAGSTLLTLIAFVIATTSGFSQGEPPLCSNQIEMRSYRVCIPGGWYWERERNKDLVKMCNDASGKCTGNGGGLPLEGRVFIFLAPSKLLPGKTKTVEEIVDRQARLPLNEKTVAAVPIGTGKKCVVVRSKMAPTNVWNDVYGLQVGPLVVRVWAQYRDEPTRVAEYRNDILRVLESLAPSER